MAAQHSRYGDYSTRYRFNGKEQDEATGFYYYGARYYEPNLSRWLSTDPLAEKYQGFSPYNYTLNNPINLVDPDGRVVEDTFKVLNNGKIKKVDNKKYFDKEGNEVDKLISEKTGESIKVKAGVLKGTKITKIKEERKMQTIDVSKEENAVQLFMFLSKSTTKLKEFAIVYFDNKKSYIYTSFTKATAHGLEYLIYQNKTSKIQIHMHSHPGFNVDPSPPDISSVKYLKNRGHNEIRAYIYSPIYNSLKPYDENSTWEIPEIILTPK